MVLGVPVYRGDEVIGIVGGSYNVTVLSQTMLNDTFGGVGYSLIVTAEGKIIAHHGEPVYQERHLLMVRISLIFTARITIQMTWNVYRTIFPREIMDCWSLTFPRRLKKADIWPMRRLA